MKSLASPKTLTKQIEDAEREINELVFRLYELTPNEIALLWKEVEH